MLPKYTTGQFKQQIKVLKTLIKVLAGVDSPTSLQRETKKMVSKLAETFVEQAVDKANQELSSLPKSARSEMSSDESDQSGDQAT